MKNIMPLIIVILSMIAEVLNGQEIAKYADEADFVKEHKYGKTIEYKDVEGSPYLNDQFKDGFLYLTDSSYTKLPLRYNMYSNEVEYQLKGNNYAISSPQSISKIIIDKSVFVYLPFIDKGGFFELLISGKCYLVKKMWVKYLPSESLPITGFKPARFARQNDLFYLILNNTQSFEIKNTKALLNALQNQKSKIESFINQEKIKNTKEENLIKIVNYYNSL